MFAVYDRLVTSHLDFAGLIISPDPRETLRHTQAGVLCYQGLTSLFDRDVTARPAQINLARARNFLLGIEQHFFPLRDPAGGARNGEEHREHGHREAHGLVDQAGIEIHVGIELARDEVFVFEGDALALRARYRAADCGP